MKKVILSITALIFATTLFAQKKAVDVAKFVNETIDLGKLKQNVPATATFTVTNISNEPLIIEQATPACGCTLGDYTKEPIAPGKSGTITATYNAANANHFTKTLTVKFAGVDEVKSITITGDVLTPEDYAKWKAESPSSITKTVSPAATSVTKAKTVTNAKSVKAKSVKPKKAVTSTSKS